MQAEEADIFQVLVRVPDSLVVPLEKLRGQSGVYIEPRQTGVCGADTSNMVARLPNSTLATAQHKASQLPDSPIAMEFEYHPGMQHPAES